MNNLPTIKGHSISSPIYLIRGEKVMRDPKFGGRNLRPPIL